MFTVTIKTDSDLIVKEYAERILLADALRSAGIHQLKPCGGKGICGKCKVTANGKEVLSCITYADSDTYIDYTTSAENIQALTEGTAADFKKDPLVENGFGMAVDIGTTTIASYLYKFPECEIISSEGILNTQSEFGADVISRIEYCDRGRPGI